MGLRLFQVADGAMLPRSSPELSQLRVEITTQNSCQASCFCATPIHPCGCLEVLCRSHRTKQSGMNLLSASLSQFPSSHGHAPENWRRRRVKKPSPLSLPNHPPDSCLGSAALPQKHRMQRIDTLRRRIYAEPMAAFRRFVEITLLSSEQWVSTGVDPTLCSKACFRHATKARCGQTSAKPNTSGNISGRFWPFDAFT